MNDYKAFLINVTILSTIVGFFLYDGLWNYGYYKSYLDVVSILTILLWTYSSHNANHNHLLNQNAYQLWNGRRVALVHVSCHIINQ